MFIDEAKIEVFAGRGGDGIVAYRRELKIEYGGPFGVMVEKVAQLSLKAVKAYLHLSI